MASVSMDIQEYPPYSVGGGILYLPPDPDVPNLAKPNLYADSTKQLYPLGTLFYKPGTGAKYRYVKAGAAITATKRLVHNSNYAPGVTGHANEDGFEGAPHAAAAIGDVYIDIADTTARAKNYYKGGQLVVYGTTEFHQYDIIRSDVGTTVYVRCYLLDPVSEEAITTAMGVTAYLGPYSAVKQVGSTQVGFEAAIGVALVPIASASFGWIQTAGPAIVTPTGATWPGSAANLRGIYMNPADGTINPATVDDPSSGYQYLGYLLQATGGSASDYGDLQVFLQLE